MVESRAFCGSRLRVARNFNGWSQAELGRRVSVTHAFIAYLEGGSKQPTPLLVDALAAVTGFREDFFFASELDEFTDEECHFRRRASTPASLRRRVLAQGTLFGQLVGHLDDVLALPSPAVPTTVARSRDDIERAAERCREKWGVGRDLPIKNLTRAVERAGVVITRFHGFTTKVDAFSRKGRRSVIVLNTDKDSASRTRFDLAHECGHLAIHVGRATGDVETEKEADYFASALLLPRAGLVREFSRAARIDWDAVFRLKQRWRVSAAALIRRAFDVGLVDAAQYQRAYKHMAFRGWLKGEPAEFDEETPELVALAISELDRTCKVPPRALCRTLRWRHATFERVTGMAVGPDDEPGRDPKVVQLDLFRAERGARTTIGKR